MTSTFKKIKVQVPQHTSYGVTAGTFLQSPCRISQPIVDGLVTQVRDGRLARYYPAQDQAGASVT